MLYKGNAPKESTAGSKIQAGAYVLKIEDATHYPNNESIGVKCKLWTDDKELVSEKFWFFISLKSDMKDAMKAETDRRLSVLLGKPEIENEKDLIGKTARCIVQASYANGELFPFGGLYTMDRKSAAGNETMADTLAEAIKYDWTQDSYAVGRKAKDDAKNGRASSTPASTPETDSDLPF